MPEKHRIAACVVSAAAVAGHAMAAAPTAWATGEMSEASKASKVSKGLAAMPLYPLAGTPLDLLSNNLVVPVGGTEVSTFPVTEPLRNGLPLEDVPVVASLLK
ncbi:MAG: hypothetical protein HOV87_27030 [Catenulispora sp.]|nr:hypothetical protein [Catenulispora sp.]